MTTTPNPAALAALAALARAQPHACAQSCRHLGIATALADRPTLLVLDNYEQLASDAGPAIARLLADLPGLHVLATSRRLFELDGEHAFELAASRVRGMTPAELLGRLREDAGTPMLHLALGTARAEASRAQGSAMALADAVALALATPIA